MEITVNIDPEKQKKLAFLAGNMECPTENLINEAIDNYLALQDWQVEKIKKSLAKADAGIFATNEEVQAVFNKYRPQ